MATPSYHQTLLNPTKTTKTTHKILLVFLTLVTLISLAYLGFVTIQVNNSNPNNTPLSLCEKSHNHTSCLAFLYDGIPNEAETTSWDSDNGRKMLSTLLSLHVSDVTKAMYVTKRSNVIGNQAVADCLELMDLSRDRLENTIEKLANNNNNNKVMYNYDISNDINIWLSAVLTNHVTCLDQMEVNNSHLLGIKSIVDDLILRARALLAIHTKVSSTNPINVRENLAKKLLTRGVYPSWVRKSDRKLLEVSGSAVKADVVVAKDGSGKFKTVKEAVAAAPEKGTKRYVIYVKKGVYKENIEVGKNKKNVMLVGDGMGLTIITGSQNVVDGSTTYNSATLAAVGDGFILQDIRIENTAGAAKHQAVALRVGADKSVINRCYIDAFQDTLYTHSLRQFFTESTITGTVDFIFGNAAVVFQNCQLVARKPMASQKNMVTAQGRTDPNQNTGTSIQYCRIVPSGDLAPVATQFPTYLGRPWKEYSRTVVLQTNIGGHIDPTGWFPWDGEFALKTLYYGEYMNSGSGSGTSKRVKWGGFRVISNAVEAKKFTVGQFIQGQEWLKAAGVNFVEGL
ncbi:pectinesterase-like [Silene latifolia]|uniref:pectinesterase-like n=1 Tax=Silene latifolia TaxID=37657 RepID=UPI003D76E4D3